MTNQKGDVIKERRAVLHQCISEHQRRIVECLEWALSSKVLHDDAWQAAAKSWGFGCDFCNVEARAYRLPEGAAIRKLIRNERKVISDGDSVFRWSEADKGFEHWRSHLIKALNHMATVALQMQRVTESIALS